MYQLVEINKPKKQKILTFQTESQAVEYMHASYLNKIPESQIFPIKTIIRALKIQYHCNYTPYGPYTKSRHNKSRPILIPSLPKPPKSKQSKSTKPKDIFANATRAVQHFYEVLGLLIQLNGEEYMFTLQNICRMCSITFKLSTTDIEPIKRIVCGHGSIGNVAFGQYMVASDSWRRFLMQMQITTEIYEIKKGQKVLVNKINACPSCTFHNKLTAHICEICNGSLTI
eukprot:62850_1